MSSIIYDTGQAHLRNAEYIRDFIFTDKTQNTEKYRSIYEYHNFLKDLMEDSYNDYKEISKQLGWRD